MILSFLLSLICFVLAVSFVVRESSFKSKFIRIFFVYLGLLTYNILFSGIEGYFEVITLFAALLIFPFVTILIVFKMIGHLQINRITIARGSVYFLSIPLIIIIVFYSYMYSTEISSMIWRNGVREIIRREAKQVSEGYLTRNRNADFVKIDSIGVFEVAKIYTSPEGLEVLLFNGESVYFGLRKAALYEFEVF